MMPAITAYMETSRTAPGAPPRARRRRSVSQMATAMPAKMHRAYARRGIPKTCQTPTVGLGMLAGSASPIAVSSDMRHFVAAATAALTWSGVAKVLLSMMVPLILKVGVPLMPSLPKALASTALL